MKILENLDEKSGALITFELSKTLSSSGPVTRGVCDVQNGLLAEVIETEGLFYNESNNEIACVEGHILTPDTPVSMNLWSFTPSILSSLQSLCEEFLDDNSQSETAECLLPVCISTLMDQGSVVFLFVSYYWVDTSCVSINNWIPETH